MGKLIDADALVDYFFSPYSNEESYVNTDIKRVIDGQPEAIVRCRDCKYQSKGHNELDEWNTCTYRPWMYIPTDDDNFCSLAKRRTDETD